MSRDFSGGHESWKVSVTQLMFWPYFQLKFGIILDLELVRKALNERRGGYEGRAKNKASPNNLLLGMATFECVFSRILIVWVGSDE